MSWKNKKWGRFAVIVIVLIGSFIIRRIPSFLRSVWYGDLTVETSNAEDYGEFTNFDGNSRLSIFPEKAPDSSEKEYYYFFEDTLFSPTIQIYFECTYDDQSYKIELERLSKISETYKGTTKEIKYDKEHFEKPAYVTIMANNHCYEYALLLDHNRIAYIYLQHIKVQDIVFDKNYLPEMYEQEKGAEPYTIYIFYKKNGDGIPVYK